MFVWSDGVCCSTNHSVLKTVEHEKSYKTVVHTCPWWLTVNKLQMYTNSYISNVHYRVSVQFAKSCAFSFKKYKKMIYFRKSQQQCNFKLSFSHRLLDAHTLTEIKPFLLLAIMFESLYAFFLQAAFLASGFSFFLLFLSLEISA